MSFQRGGRCGEIQFILTFLYSILYILILIDVACMMSVHHNTKWPWPVEVPLSWPLCIIQIQAAGTQLTQCKGH